MKYKRICAGEYCAYTDTGATYGSCVKYPVSGLKGVWCGFVRDANGGKWVRFDRLKDWKKWIENESGGGIYG